MDTVFVMYYYNGYIRGKYSADAGQNWVDLTNIQLYAGNDCDGLDIVKDKQGVHVVWSEPGDGDEVYYYRAGDLTLTGFYNVTNYTNGVGSQPSITFSSDRIHVIFNDNYSGVNTRDYKFTSPAGWQTVQTLYSGSNIFPRTLASCDFIRFLCRAYS